MQLKDLLNRSLHIQGHIYNLEEVGLCAGKDDDYVIIPRDVWDFTKKRIKSLIHLDGDSMFIDSDYNLSCALKMLEEIE